MKQPRSFIILIILISASAKVFAQTDVLKPKPLQFTPAEKPFLIPSYNTNSQQRILKPFDNAVHYTAFFCKMELKAVDRCNVWIKVHAGDYDRYSRGYSPQ